MRYETAYAKLNLLLAVDYPPQGGFHRLRSVFQTIDLADALSAERVPRSELAPFFGRDEGGDGEAGEGGGAASGGPGAPACGIPAGAAARDPRLAFTDAGSAVFLECEPDPGLPCADNLVFSAFAAMERACGRPLAAADEALHVRVKKRIPAGGGLGGGSSDAAAAIRLYAAEHGVDPCGEKALAVAAELGSDVSCFLYGGATLMGGRGELLERRLPAFLLPLVLMGDAHGNPTPAVYAAFDADPQPAPDADALAVLMERAAAGSVDLAEAAGSVGAGCGSGAAALARACANNLAEAAFACNPRLRGRVERAQADPDVLAALVTGSGSTCFAICADDAAARRFAERAGTFADWTHVVPAAADVTGGHS